MERKPNAAAQIKARELYQAAWDDFRNTYFDDERVQAEANMKAIRQNLADQHDCDIGKNFLANLPGYMEWMYVYQSGTTRFKFD